MRTAALCLALLPLTTAAAAEYRMSDVMRARITAFIQENGYECPLAHRAEAENGPRGVVMKITCGGSADPGEETAVYRLLIKINNEWEVAPWTE